MVGELFVFGIKVLLLMDFVDAKVDKEEAKTTGNCYQVSPLCIISYLLTSYLLQQKLVPHPGPYFSKLVEAKLG